MPINDGNANSGPQDETYIIIRDANGNEAQISTEGEVRVNNFANVSFLDGVKTVTSTASIARVGAGNLANRKSLVLYNKGNKTIYYGTSSVDHTTGIPIETGEMLTLSVGSAIDIYYVTQTGTSSVIVQEFS